MNGEILLLPGMGADARLFASQAAAFPVRVAAWPEPESGDTLQSFAARLRSALSEPPAIVGGASFGGMVALELAALIRPRAVILVGSCTEPAAIAPALRLFGRVAVRLPARTFRPRPWTSPLLIPKFGELGPAERVLFWDMAAGIPPSFLKWASSAVLSWQPSRLELPVFHIHGDRDRIIPVRRVKPTRVVHGGGHLLSLSHPTEVASFIDGVVQAVG